MLPPRRWGGPRPITAGSCLASRLRRRARQQAAFLLCSPRGTQQVSALPVPYHGNRSCSSRGTTSLLPARCRRVPSSVTHVVYKTWCCTGATATLTSDLTRRTVWQVYKCATTLPRAAHPGLSTRERACCAPPAPHPKKPATRAPRSPSARAAGSVRGRPRAYRVMTLPMPISASISPVPNWPPDAPTTS